MRAARAKGGIYDRAAHNRQPGTQALTEETTATTGIQEAVDKLGSQEALAGLLGVTKQAVQKFVKKGYVPLRRAVEIEAQTGVDRKRLVDPRVVDLLSS